MQICYYYSPIGWLAITGARQVVHTIEFLEDTPPDSQQPDAGSAVAMCIEQLEEYFAGKRRTFSVPTHTQGTSFQQSVWQALQDIAYGTTQSYQAIATSIKNPKAVRAVGMANNRNYLPILIPCHRVIGSNGSMTGYAGKIWRKTWLLDHEQRIEC